MRSFWWFEENAIAGMARPGFNTIHWLELPFAEAALVGWLGQYTSGDAPLEAFRHHLKTYVPKIFKFHKLDAEAGALEVQKLEDPANLKSYLQNVARRTNLIEDFEISDAHVRFQISRERLKEEAAFLKRMRVRQIVSLTERHHNKGYLDDQFELFHLGIEDLNAPTSEQVHQLVDVLKKREQAGGVVAVHCLAGIGRTSTMLFASHLVLGRKFDDLVALLKKQNPSYILTGPQETFIREFHQQLGSTSER